MTALTGPHADIHQVAPPHTPATARSSLTLCLFVDALGWQLFERYQFLHDLLPVRAPLETVLTFLSTSMRATARHSARSRACGCCRAG